MTSRFDHSDKQLENGKPTRQAYLAVGSSFSQSPTNSDGATPHAAIALRNINPRSRAAALFSYEISWQSIFTMTKWAYIPYGREFNPAGNKLNPQFKFMFEANSGSSSAAVLVGYDAGYESLIGHFCTNMNWGAGDNRELTIFEALRTYTETK